jgi:hypothetical protein
MIQPKKNGMLDEVGLDLLFANMVFLNLANFFLFNPFNSKNLDELFPNVFEMLKFHWQTYN